MISGVVVNTVWHNVSDSQLRYYCSLDNMLLQVHNLSQDWEESHHEEACFHIASEIREIGLICRCMLHVPQILFYFTPTSKAERNEVKAVA